MQQEQKPAVSTAAPAKPAKWGSLDLYIPDGMKSRKYFRVLDPQGHVIGPEGFSKDSLWAVWKFLSEHSDPAVAIERIRQACIASQAGSSERAVKSLGSF